MLPENKLSTSPVPTSFLVPSKTEDDVLIDYEWGGVDVRDTSEGLNKYIWTCFYKNNWIILKNPDKEINWLNVEGVTQLGLAFDFNMQPYVTYIKSGRVYLNWFDTSVQQYTTTDFGILKSPQISLDDRRNETSNYSDVIFAYVKGSSIYYRQQRDRFNIEYYVGDIEQEGVTLVQIGMGRNYRFQFKIY